MGTPAQYLPGQIDEASIKALMVSIGLPTPLLIVLPPVTAQYHGIYFLTMPHHGQASPRKLVLRVSGNHLPHIKTANEVAILSWIAQNTTIPVPELVSHDATANNPIAHEYTLLTHAPGVTLSDIWQSLDEGEIRSIIDQLINILVQLHAHEWNAIGGLRINEDGQIVVGPVLEETFWQVPDIESLWPAGESFNTLNISGPYANYVDYISAHIDRYAHAIRVHDKLLFMRDILPRLDALPRVLAQHAEQLNQVKLRLAHKDLHFANLLYDRDRGRITAVLDWEFSGVVPFPKWNPARSFLWSGHDTQAAADEKARLLAIFAERCSQRNVTILEDAKFTSPLQEHMQTAADFLRAIIEVSPRDQRADLVGKWKDIVLENISAFGV
ncbi:hypothetical protein MMC31_001673 [Peltigera leucophlebia]|nr:hypothetical protein [Peltigera leucophlebia]